MVYNSVALEKKGHETYKKSIFKGASMKKLLLLMLIPLLCKANYMHNPLFSELGQWPATKPAVPEDRYPLMFGNQIHLGNTIEQVCRNVQPTEENPVILVELGCWVGVSTMFMCDKARSVTPHFVVIGVDHWLGSIEINNDPRFSGKLPTLYETFLTNCWNYRNVLIPVRMTTLEGLNLIHEKGLRPHLFYVDASHDYESVSKELELILNYFPNAKITGDDWNWDQAPGLNYPVQRAVKDFAARHGFSIFAEGKFWSIIK